ncbi:EthD family reductase [Capillimicrobium parvum]|uniref:ABM domain-containing protein n=1 Tax=Capillimicrobium parvum TaxID=2884022 RepID=A0A9E7C070_9ACTN|nr:EthD family reductase [Capillimicrobium parvum]UGS36061.1 hypothetical protein DSM104329_02459 [Capillimicrobium parvum]
MYKIFAYWGAPKPEDVDAFEEHYLNVHCPIAASVPGIRRLILTRAEGFEGADGLHYRVAELGWDSKEALDECEQSEEWAALRADAGQMVERFGVTLENEMGEEVNALVAR